MSSPGLCETCAFGRRVQSARGSLFWRCGRADREAHYPRYPRLPVSSCAGFESDFVSVRGRSPLLGKPDES